MRPVRLSMQAFASYGKKTEIDFTKPVQNLFLITGDTGAGKSTIFDAIVFALYGEAGSAVNRKNGPELQSQYVSPAAEPFVELTFSQQCGEKEELYTVRRVPRHIRPLRRGTGWT
ncbi:MAG TPA: DNA repair protein, partial [Lachnospiraceae bacterium]|nr:DNA repair protein [Lachnospiraceae bacterium]